MARGKPVSGPGKLSQRTDKSQPIRVPTGGDYGDAKALETQQQSAPLAAGGAPSPGGGNPISPPPAGGVVGTTERPAESPMAGALGPGQNMAQDVDGFLRVLYEQFPHPAISALIQKGQR